MTITEGHIVDLPRLDGPFQRLHRDQRWIVAGDDRVDTAVPDDDADHVAGVDSAQSMRALTRSVSGCYWPTARAPARYPPGTRTALSVSTVTFAGCPSMNARDR